MLRRIAAPLILTLFVLFAASGCTATQVQSWFSARGQTVSTSQASFIARALTIWEEQNRALLAYLTAVQNSQSCNSPSSCAGLIRSVFASHGLDGNAAVRVATCESGLNPRASNGSHDGLFQQARSYWAARSRQYGMAGRSAYDPYANATVSAGMVRDTGGWSHWSCRP